MGQKQAARTVYSISCACGATASMDARSFGRPVVCKKCGGSYTVGWGKDPAGKTAPIAVALARKREATPLQVHCACGYRRAVTAVEAAGHNRCPGCGRIMLVEKPAAARPREAELTLPPPSPHPVSPHPPAPSPKPPAAGLSVVEIAPGAHAFNCGCGERLLVRTHTIGNVTECPACNLKMRVEIKGTPRAEPAPPPGGRYPTPPPAPFAKPELTCECGQALEIVKAFDANGTVCPACGRTITMEKIRRPESKHTVIRPRFGPKTDVPAPAAKPEPEPEGVFNGPTAEFVEEQDEAPSAFPASRSSAQEVFCPCGEALMVSTDDAGKNIQCPTCLTLMAVEKIRDGNTSNELLRVRSIGKMDQDTWSLSDFA